MDRDRLLGYKLRNLLHTMVLLGAMVALLALVGGWIFGAAGIALAVVAGLTLLAAGGRVAPRWVLRMHRARPLAPYEAPGLYRLVEELARRARLPRAPALYLVPAPVMNAFAVGNARDSAVGVTAALLRRLDERELAGVLAHEISHIAQGDLWVLGLADLMSRMTRTLSLVGQLMLFLALPLVLLGQLEVPWIPLLLLILAPTLSGLLQLALARTRELDADLSAAELTGDPRGLAAALAKLEDRRGGWLRRLLFPAARPAEPSWMRSHPATAERIARLESLAPPSAQRPIPVRSPVDLDLLFGDLPVRIVPPPRWHSRTRKNVNPRNPGAPPPAAWGSRRSALSW